jgi:uncharacterized protein (TIGR03382 family)
MTLGVFRTGTSPDAGGSPDGGAVPDGGPPPGVIPFAKLGCSFGGAPLAVPLAVLLWLARRRRIGQ